MRQYEVYDWCEIYDNRYRWTTRSATITRVTLQFTPYTINRLTSAFSRRRRASEKQRKNGSQEFYHEEDSLLQVEDEAEISWVRKSVSSTWRLKIYLDHCEIRPHLMTFHSQCGLRVDFQIKEEKRYRWLRHGFPCAHMFFFPFCSFMQFDCDVTRLAIVYRSRLKSLVGRLEYN